MPKSRTYTSGSIVYFQDDKDVDEIYVLQKGRVVLLSTAIDTGEEIKEEVQIGEFFGVKSSVGKYRREETAQIIGPTQILVFHISEFEQFVLKNTRLIMKMLKVFSKQLRNIHRQIRDILKVAEARDPSYELMHVAESFYKSGEIEHAVYAFEKYLEHYPDGTFVKRANDLLQMSRKGVMYPSSYESLESEGGRASSGSDLSASSGNADPFAFPDDGMSFDDSLESSSGSISEIFFNGINAYSQGDFGTAVARYDECMSMTASDSESKTIQTKALYEKGRAYLKLKQLDSASAAFTDYIKKHADGEYIKDSLFQLGLINEAKGTKDRAKAFYVKVATMKPQDKLTAEAKKRIERLG